MRLYKYSTFASASMTMFFVGTAVFGSMILLPLYWQEIRGYDALHTGLLDGAPRHRDGDRHADRRQAHRPLRRRAARPHRRDRHDHRDDPVRADRRAHADRVSRRRDGRAGNGPRLRVHAGDDRGLRRARSAPSSAMQRLSSTSSSGSADRSEPQFWPSCSSVRSSVRSPRPTLPQLSARPSGGRSG